MNEIKSTNPKETSGYAFFSQNLIMVRLKKLYKWKEVRIMVKWTLLIVGIIVILMGILGILPGIKLGGESTWLAVIQIIVGAGALIIAFMGKKK